jgi:tetratricopeptide (TPR) repeat protein
MSDCRSNLRSYWVEDLEEDGYTQLPYHLAAFDYLKPVPAGPGPSASEMEPVNWLAEVEKKEDALSHIREAKEKQKEHEMIEKEQAEKAKQAAKLESETPFNMVGVSIEILREIVATMGGLKAFKGVDCEHVAGMLKEFSVSARVGSYTSYLESIERKDSVGDATHFVCYSPKTLYLDLIDALDTHFEGSPTPNPMLWIDLTSRDQTRVPNYDKEWFKSVFPAAIRGMGSAVLVYDHHEGKYNQQQRRHNHRLHHNPLHRTWSLYQLHTALQGGVPIQVALTPSQRQAFAETYAKDPSELLRLMARVDISDSHCPGDRDYARMVDYVEDEYYLEESNALLRSFARGWLPKALASATAYLSETTRAHEEAASAMMCAARKYRDQEALESALLLAEGALECYQWHDGADSQQLQKQRAELLQLLFDESYSKEEEHPRALDYFQSLLYIKKRFLPADHESIASTLGHVSRVMGRRGTDYVGAIAIGKSSIDVYKRVLGGDKYEEVAAACHALGLLHGSKADRANLAYLRRLEEGGVDATRSLRQYEGEFYRQLQVVAKRAIRKEEEGGEETHQGDHKEHHEDVSLVHDYRLAVRWLDRAKDIRERRLRSLPRPMHMVENTQLALSDTWSALAAAHAKLQDGVKAAACYRSAQILREEAVQAFEGNGAHPIHVGTEPPELLHNHYVAGGDDDEDSLEDEEKEERELERKVEEDHVAFSEKCFEVGACLFARQDYHESLRFFKQALQSCERRHRRMPMPGMHPTVATACMNVALVYDAMGDYDMARRHLLRALEVRENTLGKDHPDVAATYNSLGLLYEGAADTWEKDQVKLEMAAEALGEEKEGEERKEEESEDDAVGGEHKSRLMREAQRCYHLARDIRAHLPVYLHQQNQERQRSRAESMSRSRSRTRGRSRSRGKSPGSNSGSVSSSLSHASPSSHHDHSYSRGRSSSPQKKTNVTTRWRLEKLAHPKRRIVHEDSSLVPDEATTAAAGVL